MLQCVYLLFKHHIYVIHSYIHSYSHIHTHTEALVKHLYGGAGSIHALEQHILSLSGTGGKAFDLSFVELAWLIIVKSRHEEKIVT